MSSHPPAFTAERLLQILQSLPPAEAYLVDGEKPPLGHIIKLPVLAWVLENVAERGAEARRWIFENPGDYLGLVVRRWPIGNGAPPEEWLDDARAVLTWFGADTPPEPWLWPQLP